MKPSPEMIVQPNPHRFGFYRRDFRLTEVDHIDLTGWDANSKKGGVQAFDFIGTDAFSAHAGELHYVKRKSDTWIEGDTNGDKKADFVIQLDDAVMIKASCFDN